MKVLLVRPPKYNWPFINEQDNYLMPQALVCLAATARVSGHEVKAVDCMPERIGWRSLEALIRKFKPNVVAAGDSETMYAHESGRVFVLAKEIDLNIFTVAGGVHFSHALEYSFENYPIDAIVRGEGEVTFCELLKAIETGTGLSAVPGLALPFNGDKKFRLTPNRPLIGDLDELPMPALDLVPVKKYGRAKYLFSPGGVTIHHSRGCVDSCAFCACWIQMARRQEVEDTNDGFERLLPRWRTKSVDRTLEEAAELHIGYGKNCLVFVDDTWNVDPKWSDEFAEKLIAKKWNLVWFAFMRANFLLRDEKLGIFEKLVRSGLIHLCIGVERAKQDELLKLAKTSQDITEVQQVFHILHAKYPQIFRQSTFLVGVPEESKETLDQQLAYAKTLHPHYPAFHPLTPVPGTSIYKEAKEKGWLEVTNFARFDWMTPVMRTKYLSREELEWELWRLNRAFMTIPNLIKGLFSKQWYIRRMHIWWFIVALKVSWSYFLDKLHIPTATQRTEGSTLYHGLVKPKWYDK